MATISRLYKDHDTGARVVAELQRSGIPHSDISIISNNESGWFEDRSRRIDRDADGRDDRAGREKEQLAVKICTALQAHTQIEEEIFYPAAREAIENPELIEEAIVEHASAKKLLGEIENMKPGEKLYDAKIKVLQEQVLHHVEEEEGELFPQVEASELNLEALGKKMAQRKAALLKQ